MAIQAKTPYLHFSHTFHSPSPMPASLSLLFGPLRSMSMASKPQRIRKSLELVTCKSNPNDNQQVWLGFHCSLTTFFFFFFFFFHIDTKTEKPIFIDLVGSLIMFQDYLIDAPESVGDGFSFSGGAILFSFEYPFVTIALWLKFIKF